MKCLRAVLVLLFVAVIVATPLWGQKRASGRDDAVIQTQAQRTGNRNIRALSEITGEPEELSNVLVKESNAAQFDIAQSEKARKDPRPVSEALRKLDIAEKENALIHFEISTDFSDIHAEKLKNIENLWNTGSFSFAISELELLESTVNWQNISIGVSWKSPRLVQGAAWDIDVQVSTRDHVKKPVLDFDFETGNLFTVLLRDATSDTCWTVNVSYDGGATWFETFLWWGSNEMLDLSAAVVDTFLYVGYVYGGAPSEARMRRFSVNDGSSDTVYFWETVIDKGTDIHEILVTSNTDYFDNRIYCSAILQDSGLVWYYGWWDFTNTITWTEIKTNAENAANSLDGCYTSGSSPWWYFFSYVNSDGNLQISRCDVSDLVENTAFGPSEGMTSISAFGDTVLAAFRFQYAAGRGIKYYITNNGGDTWFYNDIVEPVTGQSFSMPSVAARKGGGIALAYQEEVGEPDILWYMHRSYAAADWSLPDQFNEQDVYTGRYMHLEWLPPLTAEPYAYGIVWVTGDPWLAYFDRQEGETQPMTHFVPVDPTGESQPIVIQDATIEGSTIAIGDEIGIFDGTLCVGVGTYQGTFPIPIAAWMEVELPDLSVLPGAKEGNPILYKVWQQSTDTEMTASATYTAGTGVFGEPITVVALLEAPAMPAGHFIAVDPTGDSQAIVIQNATIDGSQIVAGDEIAIFDDTLCVGVGTFEGTFPLTIAAWMEVELPDLSVLPGAKSGNPVLYKVWQQSSDRELSATATYAAGTGVFGEPLTVVSLLQATTSGIEEGTNPSIPTEFLLEQNYPNPFNPTTKIVYHIPKMTHVELNLYSIEGKKIRQLYSGQRNVGKYEHVWDGRDDYGQPVAAGVYFYEIVTAGFSQTHKMILLR